MFGLDFKDWIDIVTAIIEYGPKARDLVTWCRLAVHERHARRRDEDKV
ncbi:hypothetical protein NHL51_01235 [Leucobacter sp. gxy201]